MFISANRIQLRDKTDHCLLGKQYSIHWRGFAYLDGTPAGAPSIEKAFAEAPVEHLAERAAQLKGVYFVVLHDHRSGNCYAFIDGSGLFQAFHSQRFASTSFLDLVDAEQLRTADVNPEALVEFFHFGNVYSGNTFFSAIKKISPEHIVCIPRSGAISLQKRPLRDIGTQPVINFEDSIRHFVTSVKSQQVSVDLTGGIDSRLLTVLLHSLGLSFEIATCGMKTDSDVVIAQQVAEALGLNLHITERTMKSVNWNEVFKECDGLFDVVRAASQAQMRAERLRRGVSLVVTGVAGELLKDFWWLQDMPFYARKNADISKLYAYRIAPAPLQHSYLNEPYRALSAGYRERTVSRLSDYVVPGNTCTYDRIYYAYKMREYAGRSITNNLHEISCYAPYLEREIVAFGYQLPRTLRFFNNFHRRTITALNPKVARIPTTEGGISVSSERLAMSRDLFRYVSDKFSRLANKVAQRAFNRGYRPGNFDATDITRGVRESVLQRRTLDRLKDSGILRRELQLDQINSDYLGRMLSLDMFLERIEDVQTPACATRASVEAA
jgi:Asparagine synthase